MEEPRAKKPKIVRGGDDYLPGNIIELELHKFMTFTHMTCKPAPRLNLVIGPNGSGKSSLVCAIALGLGGEPQLLGRATSVGAYIKRGEESGYIKISLRGNSDNETIAIARKIDTRNKSEWSFNGKVVPKKDILEIIQSFNIQVNNLTQFLPQDRVCEFAKLTPVQLLEETEKAVGDPQLPVQHRALVEKSRRLKDMGLAVEKNGGTLNQLKAINAVLEKDVERVRQREELLAKAELMKKKLPWLNYDMMQAQYRKTKNLQNDAKKKSKEAVKAVDDVNQPIKHHKEEKVKLDRLCKDLTNSIDVNAKKRREILEAINCLAVEAKGKYNQMEDLKMQEESRLQKFKTAKEELAAAERELQNLQPYEPPKDELAMLSAEILKLEALAKQKLNQKSDENTLLSQKIMFLKQCTDSLNNMESRSNKLLQALKDTGVEMIFEAYDWVQQHLHQFNKEVYGPVLLEVNVAEQEAPYLEAHVSKDIWRSFITQDSGDRDTLVNGLKQFGVPVLNLSNTEYKKTHLHISEQMRELGIYSRLDQVFDAPDAVKKVLISQSFLDHSYIGSETTDQRANEVSKKLKISDFWTPKSHYRTTRSRYGNHDSHMVNAVRPSQLLLCNVDAKKIERLRSEKKGLEDNISSLKESIASIQLEIQRLEVEGSKPRKKREDISNHIKDEKKKRLIIEDRIVLKKTKAESLLEEVDLEASLAKLLDAAVECNTSRYSRVIELKNSLVEAILQKWSFSERCMASIELKAKIKEMEINLNRQEKFAEQAYLHLQTCDREVKNRQEQLVAAKSHAESVAVITPDLAKEFIEMPTTIEELEAAIQDNISQANSIIFMNQNVMREYEDRQAKIDSIGTKLEIDKKELKKCLAEIDDLKEKWLPALRNLVGQINKTFSHNFQEMAVAGEVLLDERGTNFDEFGILIKVKFRQTGRLQVLSSQHQSGGERSVSTILYLVSLQDLTNCPFRVVDEINQGMDPINERKMFQQLVRAASQNNTPQCFLLTPKLLPDLEYSKACSILNIMNGPWIDQAAKAWSCGECWRVVMGLRDTTAA